jgi:hypothetical protein
MNASPAPQSPTAPTAPVFTLDGLTASVWFIRRRGQHLPKYPSITQLVVDLIETGEPLARIHWMIDEVNRCCRGDAIRARQRCSGDNGHDPIALTCTSEAGSRLTDPLATVETTPHSARAGRCAGQCPDR